MAEDEKLPVARRPASPPNEPPAAGHGFELIDDAPPTKSRSKRQRSRDDDAAEVPDLGLRVGEGDWLSEVLQADEDGVTFGTRKLWDVALLVTVGSIWLAVVAGITTNLLLGGLRLDSLPGALGSGVAGLLLPAAVLYLARRRWVVRPDGVEYFTFCGLIRKRIAAGDIREVRTGTAEVGSDNRVAIHFLGRKGRVLLYLHGPNSEDDEAAVHARFAVEAARLLEVPVDVVINPEVASRPLKAVGRAVREGGSNYAWDEVIPRRILHPFVLFGLTGYAALVGAFIGLFNGIPSGFSAFVMGMLIPGGLILTGLWMVQIRVSALAFIVIRQVHGDMAALIGFGVAACGVVIGVGYPLAIGPKLVRQGMHPFNVPAPPPRGAWAKKPPVIEQIERPGGGRTVRTDLNGHDKDRTCLAWLKEHKDDPQFVRAILDELSHGPPGSRRAEVAAEVTPILSNPDDVCRLRAVRVLKEYGGPEHLDALDGLGNDRSEEVRREAAEAARNIRARMKRRR